MHFDFVEIFSAFIVLFAVIDILGSIPIIIDLKNKSGEIKSGQATIVAFLILVLFLFVGEALLGLFGVDISSFAIAGSFVLLFLALEMILGVEIFKYDMPGGASIVPIAFPLIAGAGSFTTLLSLRAEYQAINIIIALFLNLVFVFIVLKATKVIERVLGKGGIYIMKKFFGIILLAIAVKLFFSNVAIIIAEFAPMIKGEG
jgi:multiple antibiotic resistance protein